LLIGLLIRQPPLFQAQSLFVWAPQYGLNAPEFPDRIERQAMDHA
jgi:hypothetical protein